MGHSIVTIKKKGMLRQSEILAAVQEKKADHIGEYGYHESPDSWAHADEPAMNFLNRIYSNRAMIELINKEVYDYKSFAFYFVDQKTWDKFFRSKKEEKSLQKLDAKLLKLRKELKDHLDNGLKESGLEDFLDAQGPDPEPKIWTCGHCNSKINMRVFYRSHNSLAERCPICRFEDPETLNSWRQKLFGKGYASKRLKLEKAIEEAQKERTKMLFEEEISSISVSDLDKYKGLLKEVQTIIAADIHH